MTKSDLASWGGYLVLSGAANAATASFGTYQLIFVVWVAPHPMGLSRSPLWQVALP